MNLTERSRVLTHQASSDRLPRRSRQPWPYIGSLTALTVALLGAGCGSASSARHPAISPSSPPISHTARPADTWIACIKRWNRTRAHEDGQTLYQLAYQSLGADPAVAIQSSAGRCLIAIEANDTPPMRAAMGFESDAPDEDFGDQQLVQMPTSHKGGWNFSGMNPDGTIG
jgi:hypothetical protein